MSHNFMTIVATPELMTLLLFFLILLIVVFPLLPLLTFSVTTPFLLLACQPLLSLFMAIYAGQSLSINIPLAEAYSMIQ
jgi:uncharacterized membrane protein